MRFFFGLLAGVLIAATPVSPVGQGMAAAQTSGLSQQGFEAYLPRLRADAERAGIRRDTLDRIFPTLVFSPRTVALDRAQPGGIAGSPGTPAFAPYRNRHLTPALIARGRQRYAENLGRLTEIGRRYGVPPGILIAIWGKETSYGTVMGEIGRASCRERVPSKCRSRWSPYH